MRIDRKSLARYAALRLHAPAQVTSHQQGDRRSPFRGRGIEFADYRPYDDGDDIRLVDWNVYLRLGIALVRQFAEERSLSLKLCLDTSESMAFGSAAHGSAPALRKADHAAQLAAALSMVAVSHRDPITVCCVGGSAKPSRVRAVNLDGMAELLALLERVEPGGRGDLRTQMVSQLGQGRADRLVLISDLLVEEAERESILRLCAASSHHPVLLHVLGLDDLEPDLRDVGRIVDAETGEELIVRSGREAQDAYAQALAAWLAVVETRCRSLGIRYVRAFTTDAVDVLVYGGLRRARVVEHAAGGVQ